MILQAQTVIPTTNGPLKAGGTLDNCFLSGSEIVFANMTASAASSVTMYTWDREQLAWFPFPVDPLVFAAAGRGTQRYVTGKSSDGCWCTFYTTAGTTAITVRLGGNHG